MIRRLNERDLDLFIKIRSDSLQMEPQSFGADPFAKIDRDQTYRDLKAKNDENFILGYFVEGQLVGTVGFIRYKNSKRKHTGFVWGVFVYKEQRSKNIGKLLMKSCIEQALQLDGLEKIVLGVSHISDRAIDLYQKMGFEIYGIEKQAMIWKGEYIDEILMEKRRLK